MRRTPQRRAARSVDASPSTLIRSNSLRSLTHILTSAAMWTRPSQPSRARSRAGGDPAGRVCFDRLDADGTVTGRREILPRLIVARAETGIGEMHQTARPPLD